MGMPEDYDDDAKKVMTHSMLLPQSKETGLVPPKDLKVLANSLGAKNQDNGGPEVSTHPMTPATVGQR